MKKARKAALAVILALLFSSSIAINSSIAGSMNPTAHIMWNGVSLTRAGGFSHSITPLFDNRQMSHTFFSPCGPSSNFLCFEMGILSGANAWIRVENTDQFLSVGASSCKARSPNIFQDANSKGLDCNIYMTDYKAGNTYNFSISPDSGDGRGDWWVASFQNKETGVWIALARFRFDLDTKSASLMKQFQLTDQLNYITNGTTINDCSTLALGSAKFDKPINNNSQVVTSYAGVGYSDCAKSRVDEATDGSASKIVNFGGDGNYQIQNAIFPTSSEIPGAAPGSTLGKLINPSPGGLANTVLCPVGSAITGLLVADREITPYLNGLKFVCSKINSDGTTVTSDKEFNFLDLLPYGAKYNKVTCKSGYAAVDLNVLASGYIKDVSMTCASTLTYAKAATPKIGAGPGYSLNSVTGCTAEGKLAFLTGIKGNSAAGVDSVQAVCSKFKTGISSSNTCLDKPTLVLQGPFTGSEATVGDDLENTVRSGIKYYVSKNPKSQIPEILLVDDQGDPTIAASVAPGVVANPCVMGIIGPSYSGALTSSLPFYSKAGLSFITPMATRPGLNLLPGASGIFHTTTLNSDDYYSEVIKFIIKDQKTLGINKPKVLLITRNKSPIFTAANPAIDINVVEFSDSSIPVETLDAINAFKNEGVNAYIYDAYNGANDIGVINQTVNSNLSSNSPKYAKIYLTNSVAPSDAFIAAKNASNLDTSLFLTEDIPLNVINKSLFDFLAKNGIKSNPAARTATLDATLYFLHAFNSTSGSRSDIKEFINDKKNIVVGASGPVSFDSSGKLVNKSIAGLKYSTGQFVLSSTAPSKMESDLPSNLNLTLLNGKIRITVDLPSINSKPLTSAFLIAPSIGYGAANKLKATILNGKATFAIPTKALATKKLLPVQIYGSNSSGVSKTLESDLEIPESSKPSSATPKASKTPVAKPTPKNTSSNTSVPSAPTNPTYKLSGSHVIITVNAPSEAGAKPSKAYVRAPELGINSGNQIYGKLNSGRAIFDIPLTASMAGKTANISVYLSNEIGVSEPLSGEVNVPPVIPGLKPKTVVTPSTPSNQVTCLKGDLKRTFSAKQCPPGWIKK